MIDHRDAELPFTLSTPRAQVNLLQVSPKMYIVTQVWVNPVYRGGGWGTYALRNLTLNADLQAAILALSVQPDSGSLTASELFSWYTRHGFKVWEGRATSDEDGRYEAMIRYPS